MRTDRSKERKDNVIVGSLGMFVESMVRERESTRYIQCRTRRSLTHKPCDDVNQSRREYARGTLENGFWRGK